MCFHKYGLPISIDLPEDFLKEETKCDVVVPAKLKKIWAVELDLLKVFLDVCQANDIKVQVFAGTLLGAARHKGFIPWDDDVDVCMDRNNFNKLLSLPRTAFPEPYFLQTPYNDQHYYTPFVRFRNSNTTGIIKWNNSSEYNNGIYIDVFVLDGKPNNFLEDFHCRLLAYADSLIKRKNNNIQAKSNTHWRSYLASIICSIMSLNACIRIHQFLMSLCTPFVRRLTLMSHPKSFIAKYWLFKNEVKDTILLDFEGLKVPAPKAYDSILTRIYGEYKRFPPACERGKWHEGIIYFDPDTPYKQTFGKGFVWS